MDVNKNKLPRPNKTKEPSQYLKGFFHAWLLVSLPKYSLSDLKILKSRLLILFGLFFILDNHFIILIN